MTKVQSELEIGTFIAKGQHADVHNGLCPVHGPVAIKVIRQLPGESPGDWKQRKSELLVEAKHLSEATHDNVVQVFYAAESATSDAILLVMEYCSGGSLQGLFEQGPVSLAEMIRIATAVCLGLEALHIRKKLHRDIKPGNLLQAKNGRVKIGDFGLVTDEIIFGYAKAAGYADHIAYEVWQGEGTSIRSDIWALGMTTYRLLHGKNWYTKSVRPKTIVKNGGYADTLRWLPHIPKPWRRVIRKMLNDDTKSRYQNVGQVMSAFAKLPDTPTFSCEVDDQEVTWTRTVRTRKVIVVWKNLGNGCYSWKAWSEPLKANAGQHYTLGGSDGEVSYAASVKQLEKFFESQ